MTIKEYIAELNKIKKLATDNFADISPVERQLFESSYDWLINNLEFKKGNIIVGKDLSRLMDEFLQAVQSIINKSKNYQTTLTQFLSDLNNIKKNAARFYQTSYDFDINTAGVNNIQKAVVEEILNQYTDNGINQGFLMPLRDAIYRNILSGANMRQIRQVLMTYIISGQDTTGKLQRYLTQTAQQAVDSYTGAINMQLKKEFKFSGYIITGSLIETSSEQCIYAVTNSHSGYFSFADWEKVLEIARSNPKAKLIPGTTVDNLPINKLHWGCRHDFTPVIMDIEEKKPETKQAKEAADLMKRARAVGNELQTIAEKTANKFGAKVSPINYKSSNRIIEKAVNDYNGDVSKLTDAVRNTIYADQKTVEKIITELQKTPGFVKYKRQVAETDDLGYSGNIFHFKLSNGLIGEIQVNTPEMIYAKEKPGDARAILGTDLYQQLADRFKIEGGRGHTYYEEYRAIDKFDPKNFDRIQEIKDLSVKYYNLFR